MRLIFVLKIKNLEEENEKLRQQLEGSGAEARVPGLDTLAKAMDKMRANSTRGPVCAACTINLAKTRYKVCVASTILMETKIEP